MKQDPEPSMLFGVKTDRQLEGRALRNLRRVVQDYPITLTVSVNGILANFAVAFTQPTFAVFALLFTGAVLVKGRHTVTRMLVAAGVHAAHHARFHRFFSQAKWTMDDLWEEVGRLVVEKLLAPDSRIRVVIDETAQRKTGAKIFGVGMVYDNRPAARKGDVLRWGLTWVVMAVLVKVPLWKGHVFAIPVLARLYRPRKVCRGGSFKTKGQLALDMIERLRAWFPGRNVLLLVDGNYNDKALMRKLPAGVDVVGRLRYDAAQFGRPPKRRKRTGRPRLRGRKMARPVHYVARRPRQWRKTTLPSGRTFETQTWQALWWVVFRQRPIRAVASRRPGGRRRPEFFYTTDLSLTVDDILAHYVERWRIECLFHEVKETMGFEDPQCRTERAVERTPAFLLWTAGVVKYWFLAERKTVSDSFRPRWRRTPAGRSPVASFSDMLAAMRREILGETVFRASGFRADHAETLKVLINAIAHAA